MADWFKRLIADKNGDPNEHIIAAIWGSFALLILACFLCYTGHPPTLPEFGGAHGLVWAAAGGGQMMSKGS